jgi:uncharacterized membrane protein YedE/YeeE
VESTIAVRDDRCGGDDTMGYIVVLRRPRPLLKRHFRLPSTRNLDMSLLGGAALFGIGWGLVGYCPGPALALLGMASPATWVFVAAMVLGWWLGATETLMHSIRANP